MLTLRSKTALQLATVSLWLVCGGMLVWATTVTVSLPPSTAADTTSAVPTPQENGGPGQSEVTADRWESLFARRFQGPLFDPPPEAPPPVVENVIPPPPIQLIATMPEAGGGSAMIQDDKGLVSVFPVGAVITAGGTSAKLLNVYDDHVELQHEGKVITITLNKSKTN